MKMVSTEDKWMRIFDIPDFSKHKKGFTIYKVISMLYPEKCPDAITKITVWKRYNDFKKLHRDMKSLHRSLRVKDKFPSLTSNSFFKRFDDEIIQQRKQMILNFLEYTSKHSLLFTSNVFVKFFETSHTPCALLDSNINSIRAELNLPSEPEYLSFHSPDSDEDHTMSDTDSISTMSSMSSSLHVTDLNDSFIKTSHSFTSTNKQMQSGNHTNHQHKKELQEQNPITKNSFFTGLLSNIARPTVKHSNSNDDSGISNVELSIDDTHDEEIGSQEEYVDEADRFISIGNEFEVNKQYNDAFAAYKQAIGILLNSAKGDTNLDRRHLVKYKIEKYLLRAEKIYNMYLSPEFHQISQLCEPQKDETRITNRPISDLYKYKILKIIDSGMMVLHSESQQLFYIKVIDKTSVFKNQDLIIPTNVPFMIQLHNYYNCENALFLVLRYSSATKLSDYIQQKSLEAQQENPAISNSLEHSDNESECSFTELLNEFATNKNIKPSTSVDTVDNVQPGENVDDILSKSQQLLSSVNATLKRNLELKNSIQDASSEDDFEFINLPIQRRLSEASCYEEFDVEQFSVVPVKTVVKWAAQLLLTLESLHKVGVICCDLQTKNLLIDDNEDLVVTYMCQVNDRRVFCSNQSNITLAPEVYRNCTVTPAVDWWSYGTILYELLTGMPIEYMHPEGVFSYTLLRIPKYVKAEGRSLLKQLLIFDHQKRLGSGVNGTEEIKSHPFFNSVRWQLFAQPSSY